jgi:dihydroorotate dehydrogenase (fumarate)
MDLSTRYLGLHLAHPIVASASPITETLDGIKRLEEGGVAAVVLFSLFEEQIREESAALSYLLDYGSDSFAEALSYFPRIDERTPGPDAYLDLIRRAREQIGIPIIASLNCVTSEGWVDFAQQIEQAGAHALELNLYSLETNPAISGIEVEERYFEVLRQVKAKIGIPIALKLSPFFSAFAHFAQRLDQAGIDALVLFNRFYQPNIDLVTLTVSPSLRLSSADEIRLPLLWIALLRGKLRASLAASTGVESPDEVIKYLLAGADVVMTTSSLLRQGPDHARILVEGLKQWMEVREFPTLEAFRGLLSHSRIPNPGAYERANYIKMLESYRNPYL